MRNDYHSGRSYERSYDRPSDNRYKSSYRSQYSSQRRGKEAEPHLDKNFIRFMTCALVLGTVMITKIVLPDKITQVSETVLPIIENSYNYGDAIAAIGKGISNRENIVDVLNEAYVIAFKSSGDIKVSSEISDDDDTWVITPTKYLHTTASRIGSSRAVSASVEIEEAQSDDEVAAENITPEDTNNQESEVSTETISNNTAETANEVVEAFLLSQQEFSEIALPSNVTYEMPALSIDYTYPMVGTVSSEFGYRNHPLQGLVKFHYGTDIAANVGDNIASFADGTVVSVADSTTSGLNVSVQHADNVITRYCHCSEIYVNEGDTVKMGDIIAAAGATGNVTGPHLHIELRINGMYVNPEYYLNFSYAQ